MNTHVNFETAKLLKEKGFDVLVNNYFADNGREEYSQIKYKANYNSPTSVGLTHSRPTIAEVVIWLYKKHEIWVSVTCDCGSDELFTYSIYCTEIGIESCLYNGKNYDSPTEAYQEAIEYTLKNLI